MFSPQLELGLYFSGNTSLEIPCPIALSPTSDSVLTQKVPLPESAPELWDKAGVFLGSVHPVICPVDLLC